MLPGLAGWGWAFGYPGSHKTAEPDVVPRASYDPTTVVDIACLGYNDHRFVAIVRIDDGQWLCLKHVFDDAADEIFAHFTVASSRERLWWFELDPSDRVHYADQRTDEQRRADDAWLQSQLDSPSLDDRARAAALLTGQTTRRSSTPDLGRELLQMILESPNEDEPRLVYADWLMTRGDPRGELISMQCELATLPQGSPRRAALEAHTSELLRLHEKEWLAHLHPGADKAIDYARFERGFVTYLDIDASAYADWGERLFEVTPLCELQLSGPIPPVDRLPALERLRYLDIPATDVILSGLAARELPALESLEFQCMDRHVSADAMRALAESTRLPELRRLRIRYSDTDIETNEALCSSPLMRQIESLSITSSEPEPLRGLRGLRTLDRGRLRDVALESYGSHFSRDEFSGDELIEHLLASPAVALEQLELENVGVTKRGTQALAASERARHLESLTFRHCGMKLHNDAFAAMSNAGFARRLRSLSLQGNNLRARGLRVALETFTELTVLRLGEPIGDEGVSVIANTPSISSLRRLSLWNNVSEEGRKMLEQSPHLQNLEVLSISGSPG